jgi:plasmid stability protein
MEGGWVLTTSHSRKTAQLRFSRVSTASIAVNESERTTTSGRSMEAEVREMLTQAVTSSSGVERGLGAWIAEQLGGVADDEPGIFDVRRDDRPRPADRADRDLSGAVATRNVRDFGGTGIDVLDPWARSRRGLVRACQPGTARA